ncbi:TPA: ECA oligosaccharide polymerase [Mannheimia haemolytica]|uniref:Putative common antigen polymerase n=2 Tax=Mannheimia haemolytica TaxID=75985 RepID=A0A378NF89_MANHA|nr:ECA oligosaccharide polymerase [Mannheimia haemolytica]AGQ38683.1 polymerase [Mannheimia haemolytica D171]KIX29510.1 polymerase [Mannheimia haemolytica]KYL13907.1 polymerase [Mannheimia haemolytica]KYL23604.1 polymerase [Mannheimia haemolytica]MDW0535183.1 ECA oligosaccharide polymerase [Mannheimia haemolytica]
MNNLIPLGGFYLVSVGLFFSLLYQLYQKSGISFHLLFSLLYFVTFYAGFPFSLIMAFGFDYPLPELKTQWQVFTAAGVGYLIYYVVYSRLWSAVSQPTALVANFQAKTTACILAAVAVVALLYFLYLNGFLLFKLEKYSQLFAKDRVILSALKRFFYFLLPALLIFCFLYKNKTAWWALLIVGGAFGILSYVAVGGTRANLALAVGFFLLIGLQQGYLSLSKVIAVSLIGVVAMFFLALARYKLTLSGSEMIYTFLYLSRDTFSPWENLARVFSNEVEYQGLMPIVRDFYVYIPQSLWQERPEIVWNTANYFTKVILGNQSGLAISPTLLGSFYIMGGFSVMALGMGIVAAMIKALDNLFAYAKACNSALLQAYCFGNLFNLIVLVREGIDAFVSRFCFFTLIFMACYLLAKILSMGKNNNVR